MIQFLIPVALVVLVFIALRFVRSGKLISPRLLLNLQRIAGVACLSFLLYSATISGDPKQLMFPAILGLILVVKLFQTRKAEVL